MFRTNSIRKLSPHDRDASIEIRKRVESQVEAVIAELGSRISPVRKMELPESLTELSNEQNPYVIDAVEQALDDPDPEIGRAGPGDGHIPNIRRL